MKPFKKNEWVLVHGRPVIITRVNPDFFEGTYPVGKLEKDGTVTFPTVKFTTKDITKRMP